MPGVVPSNAVTLRAVLPTDLDAFFEHQRDVGANAMAAFTAGDPADRVAFDGHWTHLLSDPAINVRTVLCKSLVAGYVVGFARFGKPEVGYWIGRRFWGRGIATTALRLFLNEVPVRPLYARAASDNVASIEVLHKCGFSIVGHDTAFANARGKEIAETLFTLI